MNSNSPWASSTSVDYQVTLELNRFDSSSSGETVVSGRWNVIDPSQQQVMMTRKFNYSDQTKPRDSGASVSSKSRALEGMSREIAQELVRLSRTANRKTAFENIRGYLLAALTYFDYRRHVGR